VILVDTCVWVDHFNARAPELARILERDWVVTHPFVIGELACGNIRSRTEVLAMLRRLPLVTPATDANAMAMIEFRSLMRRGLTYGDVHLLASAAITDDVKLWTRDKRLFAVADSMGLAYSA
jgi:predicted nucleic acid-binding protein